MRLFIDCSYVDFKKQPTGIPRVVLKYVETGYKWGRENGVDVLPVVTTESGVFPVRPLPGKSPPSSAQKYVRPELDSVSDGGVAAGHLRDAETALRAALIGAGAPASIVGIEKGVAALFASLIAGDNEDFLKLDVGPGDIFFFPAYWHDIDPSVLAALHELGAKLFILVHDILPITFSKFYDSPWREQFANNLLAAAEIADGMLAVSNYSANGVLNFVQAKGVHLQHVEVSHNGFDPLIENDDVRNAIDAGRYPRGAGKANFEFFREKQPVLMVGTIEPKKGHIPVIQSFERMWQEGLERDLVLVGRKGWLDQPVVKHIEGSEYYGRKLFWLDGLDDTDLYVAYKYSRGLIFGSYAEGFGIPMIEAADAQLPIICYDTEVAREIAGSNASYYSSFEGLQKHIRDLEDDAIYADRKAALKGFTWPSWQQTGMRLFDHLKRAAEAKEGKPGASGNNR